MEKPVYSFHTFVEPFMWESSVYNDVNKFVKLFRESANWTFENWKHENWEKDYGYSMENLGERKIHYKERQYFHSYVWNAIYGYEDGAVYNFRYKKKEKEEIQYIIERKENKYALNVKSIRLKIFNTGVALFILECENREAHSIEAVKFINDYGRRIYAPYFAEEGCGIVADRLRIFLSQEECYENAFFPLTEEDGTFIHKFLIAKSDKQIRFVPIPTKKKEEIFLYPALDDRMFVFCAISDAKETSEYLSHTEAEAYGYDTNILLQKSLYELAFVDTKGFCSCQDEKMRQQYLEKCLYKRWLGYGTIYTISYQAVIMLSSAEPNGKTVYLYENFLTIYLQMLCICLAQRASITKFMKRTSECAIQISREAGRMRQKTVAQLMEIQESFAQFQGQLCFEEVSSQEQGVELYGMMKDALFIDRECASVENQIGNLYEIANTSLSNKVNRVAIIFTVISVFLAVAAMVLDMLLEEKISDIKNWILLGVVALISLLIWGGAMIWERRKRGKR